MSTPIAVVGMSCRLSGDVNSLDDLWTMISRSRDGWTPIPEERFSKEAYYHPNPQKGASFNNKGGYFMKGDMSRFDAPFFHISKAEATAMDPQQRQLLECTYEALENAGFPKEAVAGSNMGVFVGGRSSDYRLGTLRDLQQTPMFDATGNHQSIQSGRLSYYFDLHGPSFTVDTACSSSFYALHSAVQSIRSGESDSAIVAGCNMHLSPDDTVSMSLLGIFNDDGRTFAFDHRAKSGFARGEGMGCLILKPLDQAIKDNDRIRSIIVNSATNQDGKTNGISLPSGDAQERLMRDVYARANISPDDTGFVEAHGTGTKVGDPIEAGAIHRVFGNGRTKRSPLYIGSVKTNVGHLENASGIISVIKATLMLEKGFILPNVNFQKANESIPLDQWNMKVPINIRPWPKDKKYISINNFGFGGSNAHVVMSRAPLTADDLPQSGKIDSAKLFVLSANDEDSAKRMASQIGIYVETHPEVFQKRLVLDMAYTLGERRSHMPWRIAIPAGSCDELAMALNSHAATPKRVGKQPKLAFVYTGQGAQWAQMGKELMDSHPIFANTVRTASECLTRLGATFDLVEELYKSKEDSLVGKAHISQPICTAVQLGVTALLSSWGIRPSQTVGHSSGEIGAAFAAGAISIEDAMVVAYQRGQVALKLKEKFPDLRGSMLAVGAGPSEMKGTIKQLGLEGLTVACENSPSSVTISGDEDAIDALAADLETKGTFNRKLRVDVAYHSSHMKLVADDYMAVLNKVTTQKADENVTFFSSLLGCKSDTSVLSPSYWVDNLTNPVLFSTALRCLYEETQPDAIVEIGPHSALEGPVKQILKEISPKVAAEVKYMPSLVRGQDGTNAMLKLAGNLFTQGWPLKFDEINQTKTGQKPMLVTDFPSYPWAEHKFWFESRSSKQHRLKPFARHDLLGILDDTYSDAEPVWRNMLSVDDVPWLKGHAMQGLTTFPLAGYLCMAVEAASQRAKLRGVLPEQVAGYRLREIQVSKALLLDDGAQYETVVSLRAYAEGTRSYSNDWDEFTVSSYAPGRGWLEHCRGHVSVKKQAAANPVRDLTYDVAKKHRANALASAGEDVPLTDFYSELGERGAGYKAPFTVQDGAKMSFHNNYATSDVSVPETAAFMSHNYELPSTLPAAFTDLFFQLTFPILGAGRGVMPSLFMPSAIKDIEINGKVPHQTDEKLQVVAHGAPDFASPGPVDFHIAAWGESTDRPVVAINGFKMTPVNGEGSGSEEAPRSLAYKVEWQPLKAVEAKVAKENGEAVEAAPVNGNGINGHKEPVNGNGVNGHKEPVNGTKPVNGNGINGHKEEPVNGTKPVNGNGINGNGINGHKEEPINGTKPVNGNGINGHKEPVNGTKPVNGNGINGTKPANGNGVNGNHASQTNGDSDEKSTVLLTDRDASDDLVKELIQLMDLRTGVVPSVAPISSAKVSSDTNYICLAELDAPVLHSMTPETFNKVKELLVSCHSMLWVTSGAYRFADKPENNLAQGLLRTVRSEASKIAATLDLDSSSELSTVDRADLIYSAFKASLSKPEDGSDPETEFAEEKGELVVPRIVQQEDMNLAIFRETLPSAPYEQNFEQPGRRLKLAVGTLGALDSLYWKDEPEFVLGPDEVEIKIASTGMNFKDVVIAMGQVASPYVGVECSGTISRVGSNVTDLAIGDRVCAMSLGGYSTFTRCPATSAAKIPEDMSFEVAASIPVIYCTAYYGLLDLARMEPGEKVLIHAASGGVGQAAIQLSKMIGAEIYATVGSVEKKQLIMDTYGIPAERIFFSRDTEFGAALREVTGGKGVDVIINSLAGDLLRESWESLAPFGRFIEIGKRDITSNTRLEMSKFEYNCTFSSVDLTLVAAERPKIMGRVIKSVLDLLSKKTINPVGPISSIPISEVETALRRLQSGKTTGKLIVDHLIPDQKVKVTHGAPTSSPVNSNSTYVIIGGTGGIGRSMSTRLVNRGAGHIVLLSRTGKVTSELQELIDSCARVGGTVHIKKCDAADASDVNNLVSELQQTLPPIKGIIHAAMVLRDVLFEQMTFEDFDLVMRSKVYGAWNFHRALENSNLDFFVVLSSVAGIVGNRGQAAYAAANTYLDALTAHRRQKGLASTSLDLAAIDGVGYLAADAKKQAQVLKNLSGNTLGETELLALIEASIDGRVEKFCEGQVVTGIDLSNAANLPYYATDSKFAILKADTLSKAGGDAGSGDAAVLSISQQLLRSESTEEATEVASASLREKLAGILMMPADVMAAQQNMSLTSLGLDSLTAIELRNWIDKELQAHLQVLELLSCGAVPDLAALILRKSRLTGVWTEAK